MNILLLNGGGLDSLCLAKLTREQYPTDHIESIHIIYGNPAATEQSNAASKIADKYCDAHKTLTMMDGSDPLSLATNLPISSNPDFIGIPFYASLLFVNGYSYAVKNEYDVVLMGLKTPYTKDYKDALERFINMSTITKIRPKIEFPFLESGINDEAVFNYIRDDIVSDTYSCNQSPACGVCSKCAFREDKGI